MSDNPKIPSWQRSSADGPPTSPSGPKQLPEPSDDAERSTPPIAQAPTPTEDDLEDSTSPSLLDQASRFLDDPSIRDAPREKKVAFLESKGVAANDIETLLGTEAREDSLVELEEVGKRAWSTVSQPKVALTYRHISSVRAAEQRNLTHIGTTKTSCSLTNTHTTISTARHPSNRHVSRVPRTNREATTSHNHAALGEYRIRDGRTDGHNIWHLKVPGGTDDPEHD